MPLIDTIAPQFAGLDEPGLGSVGRGDDVLERGGRLVDDDSRHDDGPDDDGGDALPSHPLGIRPLGNKYLVGDKEPDAKDAAGPLFGALSDELLLHLLEYLDTATLATLSAACRFLYTFCTYDELWKALALENTKWCPKAWHGTWRATLLAEGRLRGASVTTSTTTTTTTTTATTTIDCSHVFSDVLHRPFVCRTLALQRFAANIPAANQMRRLPDLTADAFAADWTDTPFVLTQAASVRAWPALRAWSLDTLRARHGATAFRAEAVDWPYALYDQYMQRNADESPLYLFDKKFVEKMGAVDGDSDNDAPPYTPPELFGPDLFAVLGAQRPAHRWLIAGPRGSGSTFHKDPNGTSAWNAVLQGAKYWVLFPPAARVPGVFVSADQGEVTSPLSIGEWLLAFHAEARAHPQCIEGVCHAGEIVHVPSGWWHLVVNLEPGIALTQNFVPPAHLAAVLLFLRDRPTQVTGFASRTATTEDDGCGGSAVSDPYTLFVERLAETYPEQLRAAQAEMARRDARRKRTWEAVRGIADDQDKAGDSDGSGDDGKRPRTSAGFTFGFAADDLEEEEDVVT